MVTSRIERLAPLAGPVFLVVFAAGLLLMYAGSPDNDAAGIRIAAFLEAHGTRVAVGSWLWVLSMVPLLWFLASLRATLGEAEGGSGRLAALVLGGGVAGAAGFTIGGAAMLAAVTRTGAGVTDVLTPQAAQTLWDLTITTYIWALIPMGMAALATGVLVMRTRVLPAWVAYTAFALALGLVIPFVSWIVFFAFVVWTAAVGVTLYFRQPAPEAGDEAMPATPTPA
jgi:hypothetical protein